MAIARSSLIDPKRSIKGNLGVRYFALLFPLLPIHPLYATTRDDGRDCEHAVVIGATGGIQDEKAWLGANHKGFSVQKQSLVVGDDGRRFDVIEFKTAGGEVKSVCFDITAFFGGGRYANKIRKRLALAEVAQYAITLKQGDEEARADAIYRLAYVLPEAQQAAFAALAVALDDSAQEIRIAASGAIASTNVPESISLLASRLSDKDQEFASFVAQDLGGKGATASEAVPGLLRLLESPRVRTRITSARALGRIGQGQQQAASAMIIAIQHSNKYVRQEAAFALEDIGPAGAIAVPALIAALSDPESVVVQFACRTLKVMKTSAAVAALQEKKESCDKY